MRYQEKARQVVEEVGKVILGKERKVEEVMAVFLAGGHILLEDIPGVGKTTMALAFSRAMKLDFKRVQFTPDVMPSDLTGFSIYRREEEKFVYQAGSIFCNLLLADEINRTSPKTQSALLEVMEEGKCTVEGMTREVPSPFLVIATQNPFGSPGTHPDFDSELSMAMSIGKESRLEQVAPVLEQGELLIMQDLIHTVVMKEEVYRYALELVTATRSHPYLERGASPRATIALVKMAKAYAWLSGREYVTPNDVRLQFPYVISHRVLLNGGARMENKSGREILMEIAEKVKRPPMGERGR